MMFGLTAAAKDAGVALMYLAFASFSGLDSFASKLNADFSFGLASVAAVVLALTFSEDGLKASAEVSWTPFGLPIEVLLDEIATSLELARSFETRESFSGAAAKPEFKTGLAKVLVLAALTRSVVLLFSLPNRLSNPSTDAEVALEFASMPSL